MSAAYLRGPPAARVHVVGVLSCTGKVAFATQQSAMKVVARNPSIVRRPYRCQRCGLWHLGSHEWTTSRKARDELVRVEPVP